MLHQWRAPGAHSTRAGRACELYVLNHTKLHCLAYTLLLPERAPGARTTRAGRACELHVRSHTKCTLLHTPCSFHSARRARVLRAPGAPRAFQPRLCKGCKTLEFKPEVSNPGLSNPNFLVLAFPSMQSMFCLARPISLRTCTSAVNGKPCRTAVHPSSLAIPKGKFGCNVGTPSGPR